MKTIRTLVVISALLPASAWAQGVRMSADFFPLDVGSHWTYDLISQTGEKIGQMEFAVEEYTIVDGTSFYVLSGFPFSSENPDDVRFVRYDRSERYFVRKRGDDEGPLFLSDNSETEITETDSGDLPVKFVLRTPAMSLTFKRGVGIVEATMTGAGAPVTAKLVDFQPAGRVSSVTPAPAIPVPAKDAVIIPPPTAPNRREAPVASVSKSNPQLAATAFRDGDHYNLELIVQNTEDKLLPFQFSSGQTYDFAIYDVPTGREIWRWSEGNFFTQVLRSDAVRPKARWQFEVAWNQKDNNNQPVPPGHYRMVATLMASTPLTADPVTFDVP